MMTYFKYPLVRFALVGGLGFLVDLGSMLLFSTWFSSGNARAIAFWCAATSNWWWNRHITFIDQTSQVKKKPLYLEWLQFMISSMIAFIPNWGCYFLLLQTPIAFSEQSLFITAWPYIAMIPGILVGFIVNYVFSRFWVFSRNRRLFPLIRV